MGNVPESFYNQSGVIPFRIKKKKVEILLISSRKNKHWVIPKGVIEEGLNAAESAKKEALEEAGIEGEVFNRSIGSYEYYKWGGTCKVEVFPMKVNKLKDTWLEDFRNRKWFNIDEAKEKINHNKLKELINKLSSFI